MSFRINIHKQIQGKKKNKFTSDIASYITNTPPFLRSLVQSSIKKINIPIMNKNDRNQRFTIIGTGVRVDNLFDLRLPITLLAVLPFRFSTISNEEFGVDVMT